MKITWIISALLASFWAVIAGLIAYATSGMLGTIATAAGVAFGMSFLLGLFGLSLMRVAG